MPNTLHRCIALLLATPLALTAQQRVALPGQDKLLTEKPATLFQIGAEDGEDWELLSGVRGVAFDARDFLYVLDGNNHRVLVFDPSGKFVRKISKQGGGPGELLAPTGMTITADGNIAINDIGRQAFSLFKTDGTFIRNVMLDDDRPAGAAGGGAEVRTFAIRGLGGGLEAHPRGGLFIQNTESGMARQMREPGDGPITPGPTGPRKTRFDHIDLATGKARTLYSFDLPSLTPKVEESGAGQGERRLMVRMETPAFTPQITFGALPNGGIALSHEAAYKIKLIEPNGTLSRVLERPIAPKKVTEADKKIAMERRRENMRSGSNMMAVRVDNGRTSFSAGPGAARDQNIPSVDEMLRTTTFLDVIPVVNRIEADPLGRIWVQRTAPDQGVQGPVDILTADGRYLGSLARDRVPDAVSRSNRAAYVVRDELGVERVVVKRLPASWK